MQNNPKSRQQWILDNLKIDPTISYTEMLSKFLVKFSKSEQTFAKDWTKTQLKVREYHNRLNEAKEDAGISIEVEALKNGLKSKIDRLMLYQKQIDIMEMQMSGSQEFNFTLGYNLVSSHKDGVFVLPIEKQNELRKQIKEYQTEISKIEGDYAPEKSEVIGTLQMQKVKMVIKERKSDV